MVFPRFVQRFIRNSNSSGNSEGHTTTGRRTFFGLRVDQRSSKTHTRPDFLASSAIVNARKAAASKTAGHTSMDGESYSIGSKQLLVDLPAAQPNIQKSAPLTASQRGLGKPVTMHSRSAIREQPTTASFAALSQDVLAEKAEESVDTL